MPTPVETHLLFKFSDNIVPQVEDDVIIIDNVYENFHQIVEILETGLAPNWKMSNEGGNFRDYYDCRPLIPIWMQNYFTDKDTDTLCELIESTYSVKDVKCMNQYKRKFNLFKHINLPPEIGDQQFYPHKDSKFSAIITLDSICSGGTAIYDIDHKMQNLESLNIFYDVSNIPKKVIQSKPNRMIIFRANQYHGGYIEDHKKYLDNWRMNEVLFFTI